MCRMPFRWLKVPRRHTGALLLVALLLISGRSAATDSSSPGGSSKGDTTTDALQKFDSPLSTGSGVTLSASQNQQTLTIGFGGQIPRAWFWQFALSGQTAQSPGQNNDNTTLFSTTGGLSAGVSGKLGIGYSSFRAQDVSGFETACTEMEAHVDTIPLKECVSSADSLGQAIGLPAGGRITAVASDAYAKSLADAKNAATPQRPFDPIVAERNAQSSACLAGTRELLSEAATLPSATGDSLWKASLKHSLEDFDASVDAHGALAALASIKKGVTSSSGTAGDTKSTVTVPTCSELREKDPKYYDQLVGPWQKPRWDLKISLNALAQTQGISYQPVDSAGAPVAGSTKTYVPVLPGASLDTLVFRGAFIAGLQVGYTRSMKPHYQQICNVTMGTGVVANDCSQATLGQPSPSDAAFATAALALDPLAKNIGTLDLGAELLGQMSTSNAPVKSGSKPSLFGSDSFTYVVSLPFFVAPADAPWGLRAGLAPQVTVPTAAGQATSMSVILFVGTRFGASEGQGT